MNEQKLIKKQLRKNMFYTFIVFAIILIFFDAIIYNQVSAYLYKSIDKELTRAMELYQNKNITSEIKKVVTKGLEENVKITYVETKVNPRVICIIRDSEGNILNSETIGRFYNDYINYIEFSKSKIDKIYSIKMQDKYNYRGITLKGITSDRDEIYIQLLANVDGEVETLDNLKDTLLICGFIIIFVGIISSYILSKTTLKPLVESYKKQTEFVQNASHELRTPLTIIQAKQELLLQEPEAKIIDKSEDINTILKETKRLTKLVKELMILAMADTNEFKIEKENVDIDEMIKELTVPYIEFAEMQEKQIILNLNFNKTIKADVNKIGQLLVILLDNAIKYTASGDKIEVNTFSKDGRCLIEVIDTGLGITKEGAKHIFDRFYREDKAGTREKGGTGIGLSIAHTIVQLHGGTIRAVPNEPKGTKFEIKL